MTFKEAEEAMLWAPPSTPGGLTIIVQQHILRLEVPVHNASLMQVLQTTDDLGRVVDCSWFREARVLFIHIVDVVPGGRTPWEVPTQGGRAAKLRNSARVLGHTHVSTQHGHQASVFSWRNPRLEASDTSHLTHDC